MWPMFMVCSISFHDFLKHHLVPMITFSYFKNDNFSVYLILRELEKAVHMKSASLIHEPQ